MLCTRWKSTFRCVYFVEHEKRLQAKSTYKCIKETAVWLHCFYHYIICFSWYFFSPKRRWTNRGTSNIFPYFFWRGRQQRTEKDQHKRKRKLWVRESFFRETIGFFLHITFMTIVIWNKIFSHFFRELYFHQ